MQAAAAAPGARSPRGCCLDSPHRSIDRSMAGCVGLPASDRYTPTTGSRALDLFRLAVCVYLCISIITRRSMRPPSQHPHTQSIDRRLLTHPSTRTSTPNQPQHQWAQQGRASSRSKEGRARAGASRGRQASQPVSRGQRGSMADDSSTDDDSSVGEASDIDPGEMAIM